MKVHWRYTSPTRNTYAALFAACEQEGFLLEPTDGPAPDVTCYSLNSLNVRDLAPEMAEADCITIAGGPHATACWRQVSEYADYVVVGEGEYLLPALLSCIRDGRAVSLPGIATKEGYTPAASTVILDAYPAFSQMKGYVEISRGCPFSCAYCQTPRIFGRVMRHRSVESIVKYASRYRDARFVSPNALAYGSDGRCPRPDRLRELLSALSNNIYFGTFPSEVRPEFVTEETLGLITRYCANTSIQFGAQSGSDAVLQRIGRGHTTADVVAAVEQCAGAGLTPVVDIIVGFPFESDDDQRATADLVRWIARYGKIHAHSFLPLPGTPLARSLPRPLSRELSHLLGSLALNGKLTGSWRSLEIGFSHSTPD
ncbi:MAG: TIGR04013 family B12-binding domain/radical SAM domain-containing protein [Methanomicrobiales archaeon]|nr:TIGR04013 family B12-binding domain/radical SAM domain-containing protein [Methanomicrobiales archaeon]